MLINDLNKWDRRFLTLAEHVSLWSKGPRKFVGAVIVRDTDRSVASMGYNGPPRGFDDEAFMHMTRSEQHKVVIHAEDNAIKQLSKGDMRDMYVGWPYTLYVSPLYPCENCAAMIADIGIKRVVAYCGQSSPDWLESAERAKKVFDENNIKYFFISA